MKKPKINPKLKKAVQDALRRHAWNMGVSFYKGDIFYMDEPDMRGADTMASMNVDRRYLTATLRIFPRAVKRWEEEGDAFIDEVIAHEVAHILTQPLYDIAIAQYRNEGEMTDAWESLTETIGRLSLQIDKLMKTK